MSLNQRLDNIERAAAQLRRASLLERPAFFAALGDATIAWSRQITADVENLRRDYERQLVDLKTKIEELKKK